MSREVQNERIGREKMRVAAREAVREYVSDLVEDAATIAFGVVILCLIVIGFVRLLHWVFG